MQHTFIQVHRDRHAVNVRFLNIHTSKEHKVTVIFFQNVCPLRLRTKLKLILLEDALGSFSDFFCKNHKTRQHSTAATAGQLYRSLTDHLIKSTTPSHRQRTANHEQKEYGDHHGYFGHGRIIHGRHIHDHLIHS